MKPEGVIVFVFTEQFEQMKQFYANALGVTGQSGGPNWTSFRLGDAQFALHRQVGNRPQDPARFQLDFVVEDIKGAVRQFVGAGAELVRGIQDEAFGKSAILRDAEGREFTIIEEG